MDYKTLIFIIILILISSQLWNILWDLGKGIIYVIVLIAVLTYIEPSSVDKIKEFFTKLINLDFSYIINIIASISKFILGLFNKIPKFDSLIKQKDQNKTDYMLI